MAAAGGSKAFMLDKYFYELQRFWDTEWKLSDDKNEGKFLVMMMVSFE